MRGKTKTDYWFFLAVWLVAGAAVLASQAFGDEENYIPKIRAWKVAEQREDCSIYQAVKWHSEAEALEANKALESVKQLVRERREMLEQCGASGVSGRSLQDLELADKCPAQYKDWLQAGSRYYDAKDENERAKKGVAQIDSVISYHCTGYPLAKNP